jgi:glycosyltransferase involved in cell wall biosynthesis
VEGRRELFDGIRRELYSQARRAGLDGRVEVLSFRDDGTLPVGLKRNALVERARGEFVAAVDDDDLVSPDYVSTVCRAITDHPDIDCVGIKGVITFRGAHPREFIHSLRYDHYFSRHGTYYRPPYHLNPIRREIAARYRFDEVRRGEDVDWAVRLCRDGALRKEHFVESPLYYYRSRRWWAYQSLLDRTESVRHPLGLQWHNRLRLRRWCRAVLRRGPLGANGGQAP